MGAPLPDIGRLSRLCGMLGSDHAGERSNAATLATRELRRAGMTWPDVIARAFAPSVTRPTATAQRAEPDDNEMLREVRARLRHLSPWEKEFTDNLLSWRGRLTPKQRLALRAIHLRVTGGAG